MKKYEWDEKELIKRRIFLETQERCTKNELSFEQDQKLKDQIEIVKELLLYSMFSNYGAFLNPRELLNFEKIFNEHKDFIQNSLSGDIIKNVKIIINNPVINEMKTDYCDVPIDFYETEQLVNESIKFLRPINKDIAKELEDAVKEKRLFVDPRSKYKCSYYGETFKFQNKSYYHIVYDYTASSLSSIVHEACHGYFFLKSSKDFDERGQEIYREIASILSEIYSFKYCLDHRLIKKNEYNYNFKDLFINNISSQREILRDFKVFDDSDAKALKILKNCFNKKEKSYDPITLISNSLSSSIIYLYSCAIALGIYRNYPDDPEKALEIAFQIMEKINVHNNDEILKYYDVDLTEGIKNYVDEANTFEKKMN